MAAASVAAAAWGSLVPLTTGAPMPMVIPFFRAAMPAFRLDTLLSLPVTASPTGTMGLPRIEAEGGGGRPRPMMAV